MKELLIYGVWVFGVLVFIGLCWLMWEVRHAPLVKEEEIDNWDWPAR